MFTCFYIKHRQSGRQSQNVITINFKYNLIHCMRPFAESIFYNYVCKILLIYTYHWPTLHEEHLQRFTSKCKDTPAA